VYVGNVCGVRLHASRLTLLGPSQYGRCAWDRRISGVELAPCSALRLPREAAVSFGYFDDFNRFWRADRLVLDGTGCAFIVDRRENRPAGICKAEWYNQSRDHLSRKEQKTRQLCAGCAICSPSKLFDTIDALDVKRPSGFLAGDARASRG